LSRTVNPSKKKSASGEIRTREKGDEGNRAPRKEKNTRERVPKAALSVVRSKREEKGELMKRKRGQLGGEKTPIFWEGTSVPRSQEKTSGKPAWKKEQKKRSAAKGEKERAKREIVKKKRRIEAVGFRIR